MTERITVEIGGKDLFGWSTVEVERGLEQAASTFSLEIPGAPIAEIAALGISPGAACVIRADGDALVTGYVDSVAPSYTGTDWRIAIAGRSKTSDLIDCSATAEPGHWSKLTLAELAFELASPYGVDIAADVSLTEQLRRHTIDVGETVWESIERAARGSGVLVTDTTAGELLLTRAGAESAVDALRYGANVLAGSAIFDHSQVYAVYRCKGQRAIAAGDTLASSIFSDGEARDPGALRGRLLILHADAHATNGSCRSRAQWEAAARAGRSTSATYTIEGWRQSDGELWAPGLLVTVDDPRLGLNGAMIISAARYSLSNDTGSRCEITVAPPAAYKLADLAEGAELRGGVAAWRTS